MAAVVKTLLPTAFAAEFTHSFDPEVGEDDSLWELGVALEDKSSPSQGKYFLNRDCIGVLDGLIGAQLLEMNREGAIWLVPEALYARLRLNSKTKHTNRATVCACVPYATLLKRV